MVPRFKTESLRNKLVVIAAVSSAPLVLDFHNFKLNGKTFGLVVSVNLDAAFEDRTVVCPQLILAATYVNIFLNEDSVAEHCQLNQIINV